MDSVTIVFVVVAAFVGIAIGWGMFGRKKGIAPSAMEESQNEKEALLQQLKESEEKAQGMTRQKRSTRS